MHGAERTCRTGAYSGHESSVLTPLAHAFLCNMQVVRDQSTDDFFNKMADQGPLAFQAINNQILFNDNLVKRRHEAKMQPLMGRPGKTQLRT